MINFGSMSRLGNVKPKQQPRLGGQANPGPVSAAVMPGQSRLGQAGGPSYGGMPVPQTGLIGAETAIGQGFDGAMGAYNNNFGKAADVLSQALGGGFSGKYANRGASSGFSKMPAAAQRSMERSTQANAMRAATQAGSEAMGEYIDRGRQDALDAEGRASDALGIARGDLSQANRRFMGNMAGAEADINQGVNAGLGNLGQGMGYLRGANQQFMGDMAGAEADISRGTEQGLGSLYRGMGELNPYAQQGGQAFNHAAALSGALGSEAQQQAYNQFNESPGQAWLREQAERAVTRNAAATGGLGGGRVLQELQRQGMGLAQQDFQNHYGRLANLGIQGQEAAGAIANLQNNAANMQVGRGAALAGLDQNRGQANLDLGSNLANFKSAMGNMQVNRGAALAGLDQNRGQANLDLGSNLANVQNQISGNAINTGGTLAGLGQAGAGNVQSGINSGISANASMSNARTAANASRDNASLASRTQLANNLANVYTGLGNNTANLAFNTGNNLAGMRYDTGQNIANANMNTGNNIAGQVYGNAVQGGQIIGQGANNIANILGGAANNANAGWGNIAGSIGGINQGVIGGISGTNRINSPTWNQGHLEYRG
jgi:hypothetical protein